LNILYVAELVGKAGIYALKKGLPELRKIHAVDFVIANADGATGGYGLGRNHAAYIRKLGVDVLTTGECCFYKKDLVQNMEKLPYVLRPDNISPAAPGFGSRVYTAGKQKIAVAVMLGQSGFSRMHGDNPFIRLPVLLERLNRETPLVVVDFHASATAEKLTLFAAADGRCSAVIGSHARVQSADETVLEGGTAVICDAGRTGSLDSVGGSDREGKIKEYLSGIPDWTREAWDRPELQGVLIAIDNNGKAQSITRIRHKVPDMPAPDKEKAGASAGPAPETADENTPETSETEAE
jgi:metallophosphoesterase (TIGR00282 family)